MAEESFQEKTESPSQRRLEEARKEGQVPRSRELSTGALLMAAAAGFMVMGPHMYDTLSQVLRHGLQIPREAAFRTDLMLQAMLEPLGQVAMAFAPLLLLLFLVAALSPMLLGGWNFSSKAFMPDFKRVNPVSGLARIFSKHGLIELIKAMVKILALGSLAAWIIWRDKDGFLSLIVQGLEKSVFHLGSMLSWTFLVLAAGTLLVIAIDVPFQLWQYQQQLKMTREEVRQESKESDGDPHVKGRIRALQREAARKRMMSEVPTADVVVTNPTHFAVALRYSNNMRAPKVVAKGQDLLAARIRTLAEDHRVPILEAPPLARALFHHTELEQEIPAALYTAVAEVLAYVYQLKLHRQDGGVLPRQPAHIEVPAELDPQNNNLSQSA